MKLDHLKAYEVMQERELTDIHSEGVCLRHKKSGARICVISNDDENKVFFIGFRTPPNDSTGVPHIIEHSVLCGSEKFPVKDPFIELVKGSMNTFLNAMTYPDKTMYPVASCNDKDFQNLMDVYLDSVFSPNIYREQNIFRQEGWHYELESPEDELKVNGVVYNEMKGAFSSADGVLEREILSSLFPDTPYSHESGGDPETIPQLTYEEFLDFHRTYYHPSNSYIYLYGNMDAEEKLRWLDEAYLSKYEYREVNSAIPLQEPFAKPAERERFYSIASSESEEDNSYLACSWAIGTSLDREMCIAFDALDYALLSTQGAPVKQALLDAGIGDDIYGGYDSGVYQPTFSVIAKNTNVCERERFVQIIRDVLREQAANGVNKKTLLAALNGAEFKFREADFGRYPKGLMFGLQMMASWLYDDAQPFLHLEAIPVFEKLRKKLDTDYFEQLITKYLLDNPHSSLVTVVPKKGLNAQKEQQLKERLAAYKASLSPEEIGRLTAETKALEEYEEAESPRELLEKIPLLSREDMKKEPLPYSNIGDIVDGIPVLWHDYDANGIIYLDLLFDARHISDEMIPYLPILQMLLGKMDTTEYKYTDFADEVNLYTGGLYCEMGVYGDAKDPDVCQVKFETGCKVLEENLGKAVSLLKSMLLHTIFTDEKRMYEILAQAKSRMQEEMSGSGHTLAVTRAMSYYSPRARYADLTHGIAGWRVLEDVAADFEERSADLIEKMRFLLREILQPGNLLVSCTCGAAGYELVKAQMEELKSGLFADRERRNVQVSLPEKTNEGFMDASQIQYVALAGSFYPAGCRYSGALRILRMIMNYDYLWQNIRVKGGAYGCGCNMSRTGDLYFYSYRDPNLERTYDVYQGVADYLREFSADERDMTKYIIGTFSEMDAPLTAMGLGRRSLTGYLMRADYEMLKKDREEVLRAGCEDIRALAPLVDAVMEQSYICAIGNEEKISEAEELFSSVEHLVRS